jgi:hypothetical protein
MSKVQVAYPEPPSKKRNDLAIELVSGSVGGAMQVLVGQVSATMHGEGLVYCACVVCTFLLSRAVLSCDMCQTT